MYERRKGFSKTIFSILLLMALTFTSCQTNSNSSTAPIIPGLAGTLAAQTLAAQGMLEPIATTPVPEPSMPLETTLSASSTFETWTLTVTEAPSSFSMEVPFGAAGGPISGTVPINPPIIQDNCKNLIRFVKDVTVPDEMPVMPGQEFTKIWQLQNDGTCTWTPDYSLVHVWGERMDGASPMPIGQMVQPGEIIELAIDLVAPYFPACYQGDWMLEDQLGNRFGTGARGNEHIWVAVTVDIPGLGGRIMRGLGIKGGG